jgi:protein-S-isoprenylcysteine O-methyltransferase Ste14
MPHDNPGSTGNFIFRVLLTAVFFPGMTMLLSGDWRWIEGWIFSLWFDAMILANMIYLYVKDPALLAERSKMPGSDNQETWDKYLLTAIYVFSMIWLILLPLDARRFSWSPTFPLPAKIIGGILLIPALYLIQATTAQNTYLSTMVRIQSERGQKVVSTGVYSFVRHPLYLGCLLMVFGAPLLVGSLVGLGLNAVTLMILVGRILGEEKMLVNELKGYAEYTQKVKYRLIPYVW